MKKKKAPKKTSMPDFDFKEYTPEEDRIYTEAVTKYREAITAGKTLKQAYENTAIADKALEKIIQADFLKILIAERHFSQKGVQVEIVHLSGSVELAPAMGLAERIVDLVDTGRTLSENGLVEVEEILRASARLIVNRASLKTRFGAIQTLIDTLRSQVASRRGETRCE